MLILISPAKTMKEERIHKPLHLPLFLNRSEVIHEAVKQYSVDDLMKLMKINRKIAELTYQRFQNMKFDMSGICALDAYDGIQFRSMNLATAKEDVWTYLDEHLCILSGFYGMVKPFDSIYPYRMEMQTPLSVDGCGQLYAFWMDTMAKELMKERMLHKESYIINLASKEFDRCVRPYITDGTWIDIIFYIRVNDKLVTRSTQAKKARGMMVRYMADHNIEHLEELKGFDQDGYQYHEECSDQTHMIFIKE